MEGGGICENPVGGLGEWAEIVLIELRVCIGRSMKGLFRKVAIGVRFTNAMNLAMQGGNAAYLGQEFVYLNDVMDFEVSNVPT